MTEGHYIAFCGGVGGSKLAEGLAQILTPDQLTIVVNTGDDFTHLGLRICPDLDTVLYMLAGLVSRARGWGREDETWAAHETLGALGGADWFMLGDRDLALHLLRSEALRKGQSLSAVTQAVAQRLGLRASVVPVCDLPMPTRLLTPDGLLEFQDYFVARKGDVEVRQIQYGGVATMPLSPGLMTALARPDLAGILIAPSNPYLSIDPMLCCGNLRQQLMACDAPVIAISPYVAGAAVKGPVARVQRDLGLAAGDAGVVAHYADLLDIYLADSGSPELDAPPGLRILRAPTLMQDAADRRRVAQAALDGLRRQAAG